MITAVDTNVLIDIFKDDPKHGQASAQALRRCLQQGRLVASGIVWAELAGIFPSVEMLESQMHALNIDFLALNQEAAVYAGTLWRAYRKQGGNRNRMVADFLVASHAQIQCDRLLSRDRGFTRRYFSNLSLIDPSK
jgi:predicted nucleic acid-binding protein